MIQTLITSDPPKPFTWSVDQYQQIGEAGLFIGKRVELIEGQILYMSPMNDPHIVGLVYLTNELPLLAKGRYTVLVQAPLTLSNDSEPAPDCAIFLGSPANYKKSLSKNAILVVELSESTLRFDRTVKAKLYAAANIPEYWIVNLSDQQIEVHRDPTPDAGYTSKTITKKGEKLSPISAPELIVEVEKLFP
jgi:Uma2 family endonuclease